VNPREFDRKIDPRQAPLLTHSGPATCGHVLAVGVCGDGVDLRRGGIRVVSAVMFFVARYVRPATVLLALARGMIAIGAQPIGDAEGAAMVRYETFGAVGDGKTDDLDAIVKAHAHANANNLPVRADDNATYYIGGRDLTAIIQTDTDFGRARFIIDDTKVENRDARVFDIRSAIPAFKPGRVKRLTKDQASIDLQLDRPPEDGCLLIVTNAAVKRYIRFGPNQNSGSAQADVILLDKDGNVDPNTPVLWDFDQITDIVAHPIDRKTLTVTGGHFTTIANQAESKYTYYNRGIGVRRSNVVIQNLEHHVTGEGEHGAPYGGFINIGNCANVVVRDTVFTARKTYRTIGSAQAPVSMGSYDLQINRSANVQIINCTQTNSITDTRYWGVMASNFSKNLSYDRCTLSRFDAHQGVFNAAIRNSTLGHMGVLLIGRGTFVMENSTIRASHMIGLRGDYGSTWEGEFVIRDCVFAPPGRGKVNLIIGSNTGQHDFGYTCYMPARITIENLRIEDAGRGEKYPGPAIFGNFNPAFTHDGYTQKHPYVLTRDVKLRNVVSASGKRIRVSDNTFMFKDVKIDSDADTRE
jgi:hypothetical protein